MTFLQVVGGRKMLNGYIFTVLVTAYAVWDHPTFLIYGSVIGGGLGIHSFAIAWEDIKKKLAA